MIKVPLATIDKNQAVELVFLPSGRMASRAPSKKAERGNCFEKCCFTFLRSSAEIPDKSEEGGHKKSLRYLEQQQPKSSEQPTIEPILAARMV